MAISEIYVDPSLAADSGAGTIGDPYGDLEYAIEQTTFDTTNGTRVNIKAGTEEVLAAGLQTSIADTSVAAAWVPSRTAPIIFRGYTAEAGDGGMGVISGGGSVFPINNSALHWIHFIDMEIYNTGVQGMIGLGNYCNLIRCKIHDTNGGVNLRDYSQIVGCHIYDIGIGINLENECYAAFNIIDTVTGTRSAPTTALDLVQTGTLAYRNIIKVDGATDAIVMPQGTRVIGNSIYSVAGTGQGIRASTTARDLLMVMNNVVEGFSGSGGVGFDFSAAGTRLDVYTGNAAYNNEAEYSGTPLTIFDDYGTNETLTASPFTDPTNMDFSPVDTGSIKEGATPNTFYPV